MKFGPAEMAQMMDGARSLITITMITSVGVGFVLGGVGALFVAFFRGGLHRNRTEPRLTNGQLLTPNSSSGPNTVYPGDQLATGHTSISNDARIDNRVPRSHERTFPFGLSMLVMTVAVGGGVLYWEYASQRLDTLQRSDTPGRPGAPQKPDLLPQAAYTEVYSMLNISPLPEAVETNVSIRRPLEQLSRERCDQRAIFDLVRALKSAGYRRESAKADMAFSEMCGGYTPSLRRAANTLLELSDYGAAGTVASELISLEPLYDNGYYLRALARDGSGLAEKALDDYITALELIGDKDRILSTPYFNMARLYEKLGRFCDAVLPIEAWVSLDAKHDTNQTRTIIANYTTKGRCAAGTRGNAEAFAVSRPNNVVHLPLTINGVRGTFVLDTGATFVSLTNSFAQKAGVEIDEESVVRLRTANGIVDGKRGRAQTIQLRSLLAKNVPIVVQAGAYGDGIDGLLGMSFLSRFNTNIDAKTVRISPRSAP
jgi:clan AA aspartic protease (TIGR02281 family)